MSEKYHSHHQRSTPDPHQRDRSPSHIRPKESDQRNDRERSRSPRRRKYDALYYTSQGNEDHHNSREHGRQGSERRKGKDKEYEREKKSLRSASVDTIHQSPSDSPERDRGRQPRRPSSTSSLDSRSLSDHKSKSHRHRRQRSRSTDEHYHKSKHSSSRHKDKHRSSRKKHKNGDDKDERRSMLTGKKIKLKVHKDAADHERDANRETLLQFLNSAYE